MSSSEERHICPIAALSTLYGCQDIKDQMFQLRDDSSGSMGFPIGYRCLIG